MKKWEKVLDKAFNQKITYEENSLVEKMEERFKNDQEIKNIINELYIKQKNNQYLFNKQRQTLKKFNIQEKIHREETKIINDNEEAKNNEIFNDTIQKLAACHTLGFEPLTVIKQKILTKIQTKYSINAENMNELSDYFNNNINDKDLEIKRRQKQIEVLNKMLSDTKLFNYKDIDKNTVIKVKYEIKKYEKDLELKASQNDDEDKIINANQLGIKDMEENNLLLQQGDENSNISGADSDDDDFKIKISNIIKKDDVNIDDDIKNFNENLMKDVKNEIEKNKNNMEIEENCAVDDYKEFNSVILNNLAWKLKYKKELSDFDNQILLYVTHSIIDELNCAKKVRRDFSFMIKPEEMINFLKEFHVEKNKDNFNSTNENVKKSDHQSLASPNTNN